MIRILGRIIHYTALAVGYLFLGSIAFLLIYWQYKEYQDPHKQLSILKQHLAIEEVIYQNALFEAGSVFGCTYVLAKYKNPKNIENVIDNMNLQPTPVEPWKVYGKYPFEICTDSFSDDHKKIIQTAIQTSGSDWWRSGENAILLIPNHNLVLRIRYGD